MRSQRLASRPSTGVVAVFEHAEGLPAEDVAHLAEKVSAASGLNPEERETILRWTGVDTHAVVYSEERGVIPSLLRSPVARVHRVRVTDEDRFGVRVAPDEYQTGAITGVRATVPIEAVLLKSEPRNDDRRSEIVSEHRGGGE